MQIAMNDQKNGTIIFTGGTVDYGRETLLKYWKTR